MARARIPLGQVFSVCRFGLRRIRDRVLLEYGIEKEGRDTRRECDEEPLHGLVHGPPGSGKSELFKYIRRSFEEARGWTWFHGGAKEP